MNNQHNLDCKWYNVYRNSLNNHTWVSLIRFKTKEDAKECAVTENDIIEYIGAYKITKKEAFC